MSTAARPGSESGTAGGHSLVCFCLRGRELIRSSGDSLRLLVAKIEPNLGGKSSAAC